MCMHLFPLSGLQLESAQRERELEVGMLSQNYAALSKQLSAASQRMQALEVEAKVRAGH